MAAMSCLSASSRRSASLRSSLLIGLGLLTLAASAQSPVLLPGTVTNVVGSTTAVTFTAGSPCPNNPAFTATDTIGDGCPATAAAFQGAEAAIAVDPAGNIYLANTNNTATPLIRRVDARTGIITAYAGYSAAQCTSGTGGSGAVYGVAATQTDKFGDGCPVSYSYNLQKPTQVGVDPYGNLLIATRADFGLHLVCNAVSPMCSAAAVARNQMMSVISCTAATTSASVSITGLTPGTAGDGTTAVTASSACTTTNTTLAGVKGYLYGVVADKWDNIYFGDGDNGRYRVIAGAPSVTFNGTTSVNPLYATLATSTSGSLNYSTVHQGYVYPIAGGAPATTASSPCATGSSFTATDAFGDGCPFYQTAITAGASDGKYTQGLAVDPEGDFIFTDGNGNLRVIYEGGNVIKVALTANGVSAPQLGISYILAGGGSTGLNFNTGSPGVALGRSLTLQAAIQTLATDPAGNIIIGDQEEILFYDIATGYLRRLSDSVGATVCATKTDAFGDGCPLNQTIYGANGVGLSVAEDAAGNLYFLDTANKMVRRASATTLPSAVVNGSLTATLTLHAPTTNTGTTVSAPSGSDFSVSSATCPATANADGSEECTATVTYAPTQLGQRTDPVSISTGLATPVTQNVGLVSASSGSALVFDPTSTPNTTSLASTLQSAGSIALDGAGNVYTVVSGQITKVTPSGTTSTVGSASTYIAVDAQQNVYTTAAGASTITKFAYSPSAGTYTSSTLTLPTSSICNSATCASAQISAGPLAVDASNLLYVIDTTNLHAFKLSQDGLLVKQLTQKKFTAPSAVAQDSYGNLLVLDGTTIVEVPPSGYPVLGALSTTPSPVANLPIKLTAALSAPTSIAVDQAENIYIADGGSIKVQTASNAAQTATDYQYTLPGVTGTNVAVDGQGNLYVPAPLGITKVLRNAETFNFGTSITTNYVGVLGNAGATASAGFTLTDTNGDYTSSAPSTPLAANAPNCSLAATSFAGGGACNISLAFTPTPNGSGDTPDTISFTPATGSSTLGSIMLDGTKTGTNATTTTTVTGNTSGLIYSTGTETTFTVTVTETPAAAPTGTVAVYLDGSATPITAQLTPFNASSSTATVTIAGATGGSHSISASYASSPGITGSSSSLVSYSIAQASTSVSWTPTTTSLPYSAALGTAVLNATANVPGTFIYTANNGTTTVNVHSASYLPLGTYTLGVSFVPTDSVDYAAPASTPTVSFTVTQATTSAAIGATQMLVAADGTGNFTTVQAAVNTLPSGGSIYIKPGTYPGFITVVQPNLFLRGLGGDPTKVILTHEAGAFGSTYPYTGEFQQTGINANNGGSNGYQLPTGSNIYTGDEGSATIVVARGINTALSTSQLIPNNFYAENLSFINGYNTDTTTTTTTYESSANGNCVAGQSTPQTYSALYNAGTLCGSQALAIWMTSDLAVLNNVNFASLQDTVYTASPGSGSSGQVPSRQYWFRGKITGDVDYIFGDAAAVFDSTTIYSAFHGTAGGTVTIHAQNQSQATPAYLSGYVLNNAVLTSQAPGMTNLFFGRPYGTYSTWVMLNSYIDQVNPTGYTTGLGPTLANTTFLEFNDIPYTDPAPNTADVNGVLYVGTGGNTGSGVTGTRENVSTNPGTPEATNNPPTTMTLPQAQAFFPTNFLSRTVPSAISSTTNWNPTAALAANANSFVPTSSPTSIGYGQTITLLVRPQTPGLGVIPAASYSPSNPTPALFTIPTGTYTIYDKGTQIATGTLDASGEAYFTTAALPAGTHSFTWTYSGDSNFAGSTTSTAYALTVVGLTPTVTLSSTTNPITYGQSGTISVAVSGSGATPTGTVTVSVDGTPTTASYNPTLNNGSISVLIPGLAVGNHSITASYSGDGVYAAGSSASAYTLIVQKATINIAGTCGNRAFYTPNSCSVSVGGYQNSDTAGTVFSMAPIATTGAVLSSPAGNYPTSAAYTLTTLGTANYTIVNTPGSFTITGGGNAAQQVIFAPLPNLPAGTYQLTARTTSGLPVTYTVTGGGASISGSTLTLSGATGNIIQVTATATDPKGDYATAMAVRSFTAQ